MHQFLWSLSPWEASQSQRWSICEKQAEFQIVLVASGNDLEDHEGTSPVWVLFLKFGSDRNTLGSLVFKNPVRQNKVWQSPLYLWFRTHRFNHPKDHKLNTWSTFGWTCRCRTHGYGGPTVGLEHPQILVSSLGPEPAPSPLVPSLPADMEGWLWFLSEAR